MREVVELEEPGKIGTFPGVPLRKLKRRCAARPNPRHDCSSALGRPADERLGTCSWLRVEAAGARFLLRHPARAEEHRLDKTVPSAT